MLDDYGSRFGLDAKGRLPLADGDGDGLPILVEFAFNLDPTNAGLPCYDPSLSFSDENTPSGLPVLLERDGELKYIFARRTDAAPRVTYQPEFTLDGTTFLPASIENTTPLTSNWEEVEVAMPADEDGPLPVALLRVRIVNNE